MGVYVVLDDDHDCLDILLLSAVDDAESEAKCIVSDVAEDPDVLNLSEVEVIVEHESQSRRNRQGFEVLHHLVRMGIK